MALLLSLIALTMSLTLKKNKRNKRPIFVCQSSYLLPFCHFIISLFLILSFASMLCLYMWNVFISIFTFCAIHTYIYTTTFTTITVPYPSHLRLHLRLRQLCARIVFFLFCLQFYYVCTIWNTCIIMLGYVKMIMNGDDGFIVMTHKYGAIRRKHIVMATDRL